MRRRRLLPLLAALALVAALAADAPEAQTPPPDAGPIGLIADSVAIDPEAETVTATGDVEVHYAGRVLRAARIVYSDRDGTIRADGPLVLTDPEIGVVEAGAASLTTDFREALVASARLLIAGQLQIAAAEVRRTEGRYTVLHGTVASSCEVCPGDRAPLWAIRAQRVIRDEEAARIHFRNATLEIFGVPVVWLPYMRVSEPGVARASGLLAPEFLQSGIYGLGLKVPYFQTLGPHADLTLTPFLTQRGGTLLEGEYRRRFARGALDVSSVATLRDRLEGGGTRGAVGAVGHYDLGRGFEAGLDAEFASDNRFLRQFDYSEADRLTSVARVARVRADDRFHLGAVAFQTLRPEEDQAQVPVVLPELRYRRLWRDPFLGGRIGIDADALGLWRRDGRDVLRLGGGADWRRDAVVGPGLVAAASAGAAADLHRVQDEPGRADRTDARLVPWAEAALRWPLGRTTARAAHVLEPAATLAWSDAFGDAPPNEDSRLVEFDETNLFALDRFPGRDRVETGLRANFGVTYARYDPTGWTAQATLGRVFRLSDAGQFPAGTGLAGRRSDWVGALEVGLGWGLTAVNRIRFDDSLDVRRNDFSVRYEAVRAGLTASWFYQAQDATDPELGPRPQASEVVLDARYRVLPNWQLRGAWRYDAAADTTLRAGGGVTYGNECAEIDLAVTRRFTAVGDVPPSTSIGFAVRLVGLGAGATQAWPRRACNNG
jgi:LPS-assembly protein